MNWFEKLNHIIRESEASVVNLLSSVAPWAAPLAPAFMSYTHMTGNMMFPTWVAWAVAIVVEVLGLSSISTILAFWSHNRRYKTEYKRAPTLIAVFSFAFYLFIVLLVNVVIDASKVPGSNLDQQWVIVAARALLTLLSVPAAIILAIRTQHKELIDALDDEKAQRKAEKSRERSSSNTGSNGNHRSDDGSYQSDGKRQFFKDIQSGKLQEYMNSQGLVMNGPAIAGIYNVSERTAWRWIRAAKQKFDV
jgi:hypothetical protein